MTTAAKPLHPIAEMRPNQIFKSSEYAAAYQWLEAEDWFWTPRGYLIQAAKYSTLAFDCGFNWPNIVTIDTNLDDDEKPHKDHEYCYWCVGKVTDQDEPALAIVDVRIKIYLLANGWMEIDEEGYFHSFYRYRKTLEALELTVEALRLGADYIAPSPRGGGQ